MSDFENMVFASYTLADRDRVTPIVDTLMRQGIDVWMDHRRLRPGQNWELEIVRALDQASIVLIFLSKNSVIRRGYVQKELRSALRKADEKSFDDIYIIPILLDEDTQIPPQLTDRQYIKSNDDQFDESLIAAINDQFERLGKAATKTQADSEVSWSFFNVREFRDGLPGYEAELRLIRLHSSLYDKVENINDIVKGEAASFLMESRAGSIEQDTALYNYGQEKYRRTHNLYIRYEEPVIKGRIISLQSVVTTYFVGAAHANHHFMSKVFFLNPVFEINTLQSIFIDEKVAFSLVQSEVRRQLHERHEHQRDTLGPSEDDSFYKDWIERGTESWVDFRCFTFREEGIDVCFSPYQVSSYADGDVHALIAYETISQHIKKLFQSALDLPDGF